MSFHGIAILDAATHISTEKIRKASRWENISYFFSSWLWFSKKTFESDNLLEASSSLETFVALIKNRTKDYPSFVLQGEGAAKKSKINKFMFLMKYFWNICFSVSLPYKIIPDDRFEKGYKVVCNKLEVPHAEIKLMLRGFVEPLHAFFKKGEYDEAKHEKKEEMEEEFLRHYCSTITLQDNKVYALFGPLAYVNHDCNSSCVYGEIDDFIDNINNCARKTVILDYANEDSVKEKVYGIGEEITVRYVVEDGSDLPFSGPCQCLSCVNNNLKVND